MATDDPLAGLARRLALPEREPDDGFVLRVDTAIDVQVAAAASSRGRREQLGTEILAAFALLLGAHQFVDVASSAAELFLPLVTGIGGLAFIWGTVWLLLASISGERESYA